VPDCLSIRHESDAVYAMLPPSCAYRLRHQGQPLPFWHPLRVGTDQLMREAGISVRGRVVCETSLPESADLEARIIHWVN
jgi:uncharacterized protein